MTVIPRYLLTRADLHHLGNNLVPPAEVKDPVQRSLSVHLHDSDDVFLIPCDHDVDDAVLMSSMD